MEAPASSWRVAGAFERRPRPDPTPSSVPSTSEGKAGRAVVENVRGRVHLGTRVLARSRA